MSYTLKKLKQSEIDRGYRKPPVNKKKTKPSYGLFVACFAIILGLSLVLVNERKDIFSQQMPSSPKQVITSPNDTFTNITSKNLVNEGIPDNNVIKEKNTQKEKKDGDINIADTVKVISTNHTSEIPSVPSIISELYLNNLLAEDKLVEKSTIEQPSEKKSIEKSEQVINLATYVNEQSSPKEKIAPSNNQPVLWQDLPIDFRKTLPVMNLNGIAFLDKVENRYIFINMDKYQVDDLVDLGPSVEEIKLNSVIMRYKNRRFILSLRE